MFQVLHWCHCLLMTGIKGVSGNTSAKLQLRVGPSNDVSSEVAAAGGQAVDVTGSQDM